MKRRRKGKQLLNFSDLQLATLEDTQNRRPNIYRPRPRLIFVSRDIVSSRFVGPRYHVQSKQREEQRENWSRARDEDAPKKGLNSRNSFEWNETRGREEKEWQKVESDEMRAFGGEKKRRGGNNATIISGNNALIMSGTGYVHTSRAHSPANCGKRYRTGRCFISYARSLFFPPTFTLSLKRTLRAIFEPLICHDTVQTCAEPPVLSKPDVERCSFLSLIPGRNKALGTL